MVPGTYVTEDGLVRHQWEERHLDLQTLDPTVYGNVRVGKWEGEDGWVVKDPHRRKGREGGIGGL